MRELFFAKTVVSQTDFGKMASDLRQRHSGIELLQWLPLVKRADRTAFETAAKAKITGFEIKEKSEDGLANVRSGEYPEYVPVLYVDPKKENAAAIGFDYYRGPHQRAIFRARDTGKISATRHVPLGGPAGNEFGWSLFLPLYTSGPDPKTAEERQVRLRGYLQGTFRLSDLVTECIEDAPTGAAEVLFVDRTPGGTEPYLIAYAGGSWKTAPPPAAADFQRGLHRTFRVNVGGRDWSIFFRPSPAWIAAQAAPYSWAALGGGLILTALLGSLIFSTQRRAALVAHLVEQRTAELRATQESLREDIQRRETVEQALREGEDRYRAFVEQSTEAIWRFEHEPPIPTHLPVDKQIDLMYRDARLAECNDLLAQMYGYTRSKEMIGVHLNALVPRSNPQNVAYFRAFIEHDYRLVDWETREVDKDGNVKYFLNNETGIVEDGLLKRAWGMQRDITERKRHEEKQVEQDTRMRLAVAAAHLGTWDWDLRANRLIWSAEAERIFGLEAGALDGTTDTYLSLVHPDDRDRIQAAIRDALEIPGESGTDYELRIIRRDGSMHWIVARGAVLRDSDGQPFRMLGSVMDVTAQHLADEEKDRIERKLQETQKLESLGVLAGGIAHDFNNLLTGILGNASLARMDLPEDSPAQPSLEQIEIVSQRAADLCRQMLAYSGKGRFLIQQLDLSVLVRDTADFLQLSISKSAILNYSLAKDLPAISADTTQIRQILMNLVINASEAFREKSGMISIATGLMRADRAYLAEAHLSPNIPEGDYVFLEVTDNGSGMDAETKAKIFDPFFTTKFTGRGLGLAAVLGIVRGHSGALRVSSEPGQGTTFKLLLPRADGPADDLQNSTVTRTPWRGTGTMLVVDDEDSVRTVSTRMLEAMGFTVRPAMSGNAALEIFREHRKEIVGVLLDLTMPQLDGAATFKEMRQIDPDIRVLLMSGFTEQDAVNRFAGKGLAGFIQKPFKSETLQSKLRAIFEAEPPNGSNLSLDPPIPAP